MDKFAASRLNANQKGQHRLECQLYVFLSYVNDPLLMYYSFAENTKFADSKCNGVKSLHPTWLEDETVARAAADGSSNTRGPCTGSDLSQRNLPALCLHLQYFQIMTPTHMRTRRPRTCDSPAWGQFDALLLQALADPISFR